ncbi:MAG: FHA domain-containing protein [Fuerstiella sp.]
MSAFLRVRTGKSTRDIAVLQPDQPLTIGRGEPNDVAFPDDGQMSFHHATLELQADDCLLRDLQSTNGTFVDGKPVESAVLKHGDAFLCGTTEFVLDWPSENDPRAAAGVVSARPDKPTRPASTGSDPRMAATVVAGHAGRSKPGKSAAAPTAKTEQRGDDMERTDGFRGATALEIVQRFKLHQKISVTPEDDETPTAFLERIRPLRDGADALCFLAFALVPRCAVWWAVECLRSVCQLTDEDQDALGLTEVWLSEPTDENRRAAASFVQISELESTSAWVAQAAFYSHGSTTPPNCPAIPPKDTLAGTMVLAAVTLAAVEAEPPQIPERRSGFIDLAQKIALGEHPWPEPAE